MRSARLLAALLIIGCSASTPATEPPAVRPLTELDRAQLRLFLQGVPDDWRGQSDQFNGIPPPPAFKPLPEDARLITLPPPDSLKERTMSLSEAIATRRSERDFSARTISLEQLAFLLWHAQGVTQEMSDGDDGLRLLRAAPSAGARYPLETYVFAHRVQDLDPGVYRYDVKGHQLVHAWSDPDVARYLRHACFDADLIGDAAAVIAFTAVPYRTEWRYGPIAHRMIAYEAGHAAQNIGLAAVATGLGSCPVAAYHQPSLDRLLRLDPEEEFTLYLVAIGYVADSTP